MLACAWYVSDAPRVTTKTPVSPGSETFIRLPVICLPLNSAAGGGAAAFRLSAAAGAGGFRRRMAACSVVITQWLTTPEQVVQGWPSEHMFGRSTGRSADLASSRRCRWNVAEQQRQNAGPSLA